MSIKYPLKLLTLSFLLCLLGFAVVGQSDSIKYSFFVAGHVYGEPGVNNKGVHPPFKQKYGYIKSRPEIEFGVFVGDIVSPNPLVKDWMEVDEDIQELRIPVHFAVGNHDMENRPVFEQRYGRTYFSYSYDDDLFIILDPLLDGWNISGNQLDFLKKTLSQNHSNKNNIFVFFHHILWNTIDNEFNYIYWNSAEGRDQEINFWTEIEPMFYALNNPVTFFAGDLGASWSSDFSYDKYDNITLISTGMGHPEGENFVIANVHKDNSITYDLICLSDSNLYCFGNIEDYLVIDNPKVERKIALTPYPNPADEVFILVLNRDVTYNISMYNLQGELVLYQRVEDTAKHHVNTTHLESGLYFVRVQGAEIDTVNRIVIR